MPNCFLKRVLIAALFLLTGCDDPDAPACLRPTGEIVRETRELPLFFGVAYHDGIEVILTPDTTQRITVEGGQNLLPYVRTEVRGEVLHLHDDNTCRWVRRYDAPLRVYIRSPRAYYFRAFGHGDFRTTDTLRGANLAFEHYGYGRVDLLLRVGQATLNANGHGPLHAAGRADSAYLMTQGVSELRADSLRVGRVGVFASGLGHTYSWATQSLRAALSGGGDVYYRGTPPLLTVEATGAGRAVPLD